MNRESHVLFDQEGLHGIAPVSGLIRRAMHRAILNGKTVNDLGAMLSSGRAFVLALFGVLLTVAGTASGGTLSVQLERPDSMKVLNNNFSWDLILNGEIDNDAPARVAAALSQVGSDGVDVYLNSPGGSLFAGLKIGRMIRKAGGNTHIGVLVPDNDHMPIKGSWLRAIPGGCYSACSLAFLGGVYRFSDGKSEYGVHRFSSSTSTSSDLDAAQVITAAVANFIREMDVDTALLDLMTSSGKDGMRMLSQQEMKSLRVVNNGRGKAEWSIEAMTGGQYLRGVQSSMYGRAKSVFFCDKNGMLFMSFYTAGEENARSIANGGRVHSLLTDGKQIRLGQPLKATATKDEIATRFSLTKEQALALADSSQIGHAMQFAYEAPTFIGYYIDVPKESREKVSAFIKNCYR